METRNSINDVVNSLREGEIVSLNHSSGSWICCDATKTDIVSKSGFEQLPAPLQTDSNILVSGFNMLDGYTEFVPESAYQLMEVSEECIRISYPLVKNLSVSAISSDGSATIVLINNGFVKNVIDRFRKPLLSFSASPDTSITANLEIDILEPLVFSKDIIKFNKDESFKIIRG
jgi:L-threonylcarbamoyladenylate synthase